MSYNETILDKLYGVFKITKLENGNYEFEECCDNYFTQELTKQQMQELIIELQELIK